MSQVRREALLEPAYSKDEVKQAIRLKEKVRQQRKFSNTSINPLTNVGQGLRHWSRNKKVKRAVRNLNKQNDTTTESSVAKKDNIYSGWWLPLSDYIF
eukprot:scaffold602781_cov59-Attheya_sp.AAC.1